MAKRRLGRGIDALIPVVEGESEQGILELDPEDIVPDPLQPRQVFHEDKIDELAESFRHHGVIQPLTVRLVEGQYRLIAGERRLRAALKAGIKVPVVVKSMDDREAMEVSLVENLQREDLGILEQAEAFKRLMDEFGLTQEDVAKRVGKSRPDVANTLRLLRLEREVKEMISEETITGGHGRALLRLEGRPQIDMAKECVKKGFSVRQLEKAVTDLGRSPGQRAATGAVRRKDAEVLLSEALGSPVEVSVRGSKGSINISFFGEEDLERIVEFIQDKS